MKLSVLLLTAVSVASAQDVFQQGAEVFRKSCAQGYCHGTAGAQGRAPKLVGRNYEQAAVTKIIREGVPNTGMPGFATLLQPSQLEAVIAYVTKISGGTYAAGASAAASTGGTALSAEARKGKDLFFDAVRGVNRCGTCHTVEGMGTAVGPNLATAAPAPDAVTIAAIRRGRGAGLRLAQLAGLPPFPALVVEQTADTIRLFDLTSVPPVLCTVAKGDVTLSSGAAWSHSDAVRNYSDADLTAIAAYLRWLAAQ